MKGLFKTWLRTLFALIEWGKSEHFQNSVGLMGDSEGPYDCP
jgi:hypothetical protein